MLQVFVCYAYAFVALGSFPCSNRFAGFAFALCWAGCSMWNVIFPSIYSFAQLGKQLPCMGVQRIGLNHSDTLPFLLFLFLRLGQLPAVGGSVVLLANCPLFVCSSFQISRKAVFIQSPIAIFKQE